MRRTTVLGAVVGVVCTGAVLAGGIANAAPSDLPLPPLAGGAGPTVTCTSDPNVFNTGYDAATGTVLADGAKDANWQASDMLPASGTVAPPPPATTFTPAGVGKLVSAWTDSPFGNAQWISRQSGADASHQEDGDWYYRFSFVLSPEVNPRTFALPMTFFADNAVAEIFVNGTPQSPKVDGVPQYPVTPDDAQGRTGIYYQPGFQADQGAETTLDQDWHTGPNELVVQVKSGIPFEGFLAQVRPGPTCTTPPAPPSDGGLCDGIGPVLGGIPGLPCTPGQPNEPDQPGGTKDRGTKTR